MSKKTKVAGNPALDATLPDVSIEIKGETYHLCFDYAALSIAERKLSDVGIKVNMLEALDLRGIGAERLPIVFFAALVKAQPDITYEEASALITMKNYADIFSKVVEAFVASMAEPKTAEETKAENPTVEPAA
jgi:hypothetical protein